MITPTYATPDNSRYSYDEWKCPSGISWYNDSTANTVVFIVKETQPAGSSFTVKRKVSSPSRRDYYQIFEIKMVEHNH